MLDGTPTGVGGIQYFRGTTMKVSEVRILSAFIIAFFTAGVGADYRPPRNVPGHAKEQEDYRRADRACYAKYGLLTSDGAILEGTYGPKLSPQEIEAFKKCKADAVAAYKNQRVDAKAQPASPRSNSLAGNVTQPTPTTAGTY